MDTKDNEILEELSRTNRISVVPPGDNDDHYIISYARENNAFVVSNDLFLDHMRGVHESSIKRSMTLWLRANRCSYTFVHHDFMLNPKCILMEVINDKIHTTPLSMEVTNSTDDNESNHYNKEDIESCSWKQGLTHLNTSIEYYAHCYHRSNINSNLTGSSNADRRVVSKEARYSSSNAVLKHLYMARAAYYSEANMLEEATADIHRSILL